ncbi:MAG: hypothetical protein HQL93_05880, partial [Magnetococcales bacterium]|nr:hypothetical protein [Magnetococcales bacterium]
MFKQERSRKKKWPLLVILSSMLAGCAVPSHMQVRTDIDPANEDDQVRFRTTYYYRVVDMCGDSPINVKALYRFKMSGKAGALGNTVHFESGTLKDYEIDPFGASVSYNGDTKRFEYKNNNTDQDCKVREKNGKDLLNEFKSLCTPNDDAKKKAYNEKPLLVALSECKTTLASDKETLQKFTQALDALTACTNSTEEPTSMNCGDNKVQEGFQVFGPEGWRTFNQHDRLMLAMYSNGQPLIQSLQQVSRVML